MRTSLISLLPSHKPLQHVQPPDPAPGTGLYPADLDAQDHHQIQIQIYHPPPLHQSKPGNKGNIINNDKIHILHSDQSYSI